MTKSATPSAPGAAASLLLVDDQEKNLISLEAILEPLGQHLVTARSGEEALRQLLNHDFALILLDVQMPGLDGFETARLIKQRERTRHIPIIFLTALSTEEEHVFRGYNVGAIDYLSKPFRPELLRSKVMVLLDIHHRSVRLRQEAEEEKARKEVEVAQVQRRGDVRLRSLADAMPQIVFLADHSGRLLYTNRRWSERAGTGPEHIPSFDDLLLPEDRGPFQQAWSEAVQLRRPWEAEYRLGGGGNEPRWHLVRVLLMETESGTESETWVGTSTDIDDQKRLTELISRRSEALELADQAKDQFLAMLSHELRTPLNAVLGWAQVLRRQTPDASTLTKGLDTIERNARMQAQLINDLLDISRIISGKLHIDKTHVDLKRVVTAAMDTIRPEANQRGVQLTLSLPDDPVYVIGDSARLQQVIWNLLSNAVKFTHYSGEVRCELLADLDRVHVRVQDTGEGIDPAFLPHVFDRFRQQDSTSSRTHGGLGLGLAIVHHLIELHGGAIRAQSEGSGKGSTFSLNLPRHDPPSNRPSLRRPAQSGSKVSLAGLQVLVVEDDEDACAFLCTMLNGMGAQTEGVGTVEEGLRALHEHSWSVLLSDIGLPDGDGLQLIRRYRATEPPSAHLPAIAITAFASNQDRRRALEAGFDEHLPKPLDGPTLLWALTRLQLISGPNSAAPPSAGPPSTGSIPPPSLSGQDPSPASLREPSPHTERAESPGEKV